jgi:hypothetical protein
MLGNGTFLYVDNTGQSGVLFRVLMEPYGTRFAIVQAPSGKSLFDHGPWSAGEFTTYNILVEPNGAISLTKRANQQEAKAQGALDFGVDSSDKLTVSVVDSQGNSKPVEDFFKK